MAKIRVYELARELEKDNKRMQEIVRDLGFEIKNYMSTLTEEEAEQVRRHVQGGSASSKANVSSNNGAKPPKTNVIRRRGLHPRPSESEAEVEEIDREHPRVHQEQHPLVEVAQVKRRRVPPPISVPTSLGETETQRKQQEVKVEPQQDQGIQQLQPSSRGSVPIQPDVLPQERDSFHEVAFPSGLLSTTQQQVETFPPHQVTQVKTGKSEKREVHRSALEENVPTGQRQSVPEPIRVPAVGTRIELPAKTRQLPGGLAQRMVGDLSRSTPSPTAVRRQRERERDNFASNTQTTVTTTPQEALRVEENVVTSMKPSKKASTAASDRVLRDEEGTIIGPARSRPGPKIISFISLPDKNKKRTQQVIITEASEKIQSGRATKKKDRESRFQQQGRSKVSKVQRKPVLSRVTTQEKSEAKKRIRIDEAIQISDLAHQMGKKVGDVMRVLWGMGLRGLTINNAVDIETAELVAGEFGYTIENVTFQEDAITGSEAAEELEWRAPVVTIMGHVDHGKTSLLDKIRSTRVVDAESGGITQHIGAYKVDTANGSVVFLDTPGHEAFSSMRSRGAQVTDVVVLVVAADDGVMPTTVEAIKHANDAKVPIIVAINKCDKPDANPGRVKQMLMEYGLVGEEFGGETIIVEVSAKTGKGIDKLLEMLALQSELLELRASSRGRVSGVVLEARVDKGRGPIATILVESGTLHKGDIMVANEFSGKVRTMFDDRGRVIEDVGPSTPVEVLGLDGVPSAGDRFNVVESEKAARQLIAHRRESRRRKESVRSGPSIQDFITRHKVPILKIVLRADVQGSAEALRQAITELSTEKVKVDVIFSGVGAITQTDVKMASAGDAVIIGFNVKPVGKAGMVAEADKVEIFTCSIIYEALEHIRKLMVDLLEPEFREKEQGEAEVRALFPIPKLGVVAGCRVIRGLIQRSSGIRVVRNGQIIHKGSIASLRVFKDDVREVREGFECGIVVANFLDVEPGDTIQSFEIETIAPSL